MPSIASPPARTSSRLVSVDFLRGLVMVLMALDHTRGMVNGTQVDAMDLTHTKVALFGIAMIALHNLLDGVQAQSFGAFAPVWGILHGGYNLKVSQGLEFRPLYALVPWVGVMAAGYGFGSFFALEPKVRQQKLFW